VGPVHPVDHQLPVAPTVMLRIRFVKEAMSAGGVKPRVSLRTRGHGAKESEPAKRMAANGVGRANRFVI
jgi:hypothetical protein